MIFMNYKIMEYFKNSNEKDIKSNIQKIITTIIVNEKISSS